MRRLFEGGVTNAETLAAGDDYSRAATIRGRRLIDEIRYAVRITRNSYHTFMSPIREVDMMHILYSGVASGLVDRVLTTPKI